MIKEAHFLSVKKASSLQPDQNTVVVSILDASKESLRPSHLSQFKDHLVLQFFDADEMYYEDHWPAQMSPAQHREACGVPLERAPELSDAKRIVEFLARHAHSTDEVTLVVHCFAGISRSAAVAEFAAVTHGAQLPQVDGWLKTTDGANKRLLRLLDQAAGRK